MWGFRIACFVSLCGLLWAVAVISPYLTVRESVPFVLILVILGACHVTVIMRHVDDAPERFKSLWAGCLCGAVDAALVLLLLLIAGVITNGMGPDVVLKKDGSTFDKAIVITAWIIAFVLPQRVSPWLTSLLLPKAKQRAGLSAENKPTI
jgi:hypothetical protein